ncbi:unnamed protein product [Lepeophtheirus salmonis]|uniref:(salmon louse) hypothetical protein n=1 Tax=Lepeophtheirus salmonis TaxID=72036 RepID=A0A7R8H2W0_LEPSM|nr:unnamed protein product [Lepeophtheirus salmonis]CAF2836193.1 unnamed protein product [Lepeophtheirus salmonis]
MVSSSFDLCQISPIYVITIPEETLNDSATTPKNKNKFVRAKMLFSNNNPSSVLELERAPKLSSGSLKKTNRPNEQEYAEYDFCTIPQASSACPIECWPTIPCKGSQAGLGWLVLILPQILYRIQAIVECCYGSL